MYFNNNTRCWNILKSIYYNLRWKRQVFEIHQYLLHFTNILLHLFGLGISNVEISAIDILIY